MKCEHKGCEKEATIIVCENHIDEDYPPNPEMLKEQAKQIIKDFKDNPYIIQWDNPKGVKKYNEIIKKWLK